MSTYDTNSFIGPSDESRLANLAAVGKLALDKLENLLCPSKLLAVITSSKGDVSGLLERVHVGKRNIEARRAGCGLAARL